MSASFGADSRPQTNRQTNEQNSKTSIADVRLFRSEKLDWSDNTYDLYPGVATSIPVQLLDQSHLTDLEFTQSPQADISWLPRIGWHVLQIHNSLTIILLGAVECNIITVLFHKWSVLLTKYFSGDKIDKNEMGGACSAYGEEKRCIEGFGAETWRKETTCEIQA